MMSGQYEDEARERFNQVCAHFFTVGRVIGYAEDDEDCYWIVREGGSASLWLYPLNG